MQLRKGRRAKRVKVKQGMRSSCGGARRWRNRLVNLTDKGMSSKDVLGTVNLKREGDREHANAELEEMVGKSMEEKEAEQAEVAKVKERRTRMNTKVPTHGTWRMNKRKDKDVTSMGVNINSLSYWLKQRNTAAQLRHVFQKYGVDSA